MSRDEMIEALEQMGFDTSKITEGVPDEFLADILGKLAEPEGEVSPENASEPADASDMADDAGQGMAKDRAGMVADLEKVGYDDDDLTELTDEEIADLYKQECGPGAEEHAEYTEGEKPGEEKKPDAEKVEKAADAETADAANVATAEKHAEGEAKPEQAKRGAGDAAAAEKPAGAPAVAADPAGVNNETMRQMLEGYGYDPSELEKMSDDEVKTAYGQMMAEQEQAQADNVQGKTENPPPAKPEAGTAQYSEKAALARLNAKANRTAQLLKQQAAQANRLEAETRRKSITVFCEALRAAGKLLPFEFESTVDRLFRANHLQKVTRFSEDKKTKVFKTELELQMEELEKRPCLVRFGERLPQPQGAADSEKTKIENHYEQFSESYKKLGQSKEKVVGAFDTARRSNPALTADEFLGK